jgi:hypothetical protein
MEPKMRRNLTGSFLPQNLGHDGWLLVRAGGPDTHAPGGAHANAGNDVGFRVTESTGADPAPGVEIFLRGVTSEAAEILRGATVSDIAVEWHGDAVELTLMSGAARRILHLRSVIIHEPLPLLYGALPLAGFDDRAKRFWRRVFRLARIPGGRHLLGILARRRRNAG